MTVIDIIVACVIASLLFFILRSVIYPPDQSDLIDKMIDEIEREDHKDNE